MRVRTARRPQVQAPRIPRPAPAGFDHLSTGGQVTSSPIKPGDEITPWQDKLVVGDQTWLVLAALLLWLA